MVATGEPSFIVRPGKPVDEDAVALVQGLELGLGGEAHHHGQGLRRAHEAHVVARAPAGVLGRSGSARRRRRAWRRFVYPGALLRRSTSRAPRRSSSRARSTQWALVATRSALTAKPVQNPRSTLLLG